MSVGNKVLTWVLTVMLFVLPDTMVDAANLVVGDYDGRWDVSASGAASYSIPIECPVGVNGMMPTVVLCYNSQNGMANAGWGWGVRATSVMPTTASSASGRMAISSLLSTPRKAKP